MVQIDHHEYLSEEEKRLKEDRERTKYWKKWGPYVAERQWATGKYLFLFYSRFVTNLHQFVRTIVQMGMHGAVSLAIDMTNNY